MLKKVTNLDMIACPDSPEKTSRKIIHVDMDCFFAAVEMRDNPALATQPVAVGGRVDERGVICTANYIAREYGVRSAMATATALRLCKPLIVLPPNMSKYREISGQIRRVFQSFTEIIEPMGLDEAYLDVTGSAHCHGSATLIAEAIRHQIWETQRLTASAGVSPNKLLSKIASNWKKPNGLCVIRPEEVQTFIRNIPVRALHGIGQVTARKLESINLVTCADLQQWSLFELTRQFGKLGQYLYEQSRGLDPRRVEPNRVRKSMSVEQTFPRDLEKKEDCLNVIRTLFNRLMFRIQASAAELPVRNQGIKIKFNDFKLMTTEVSCQSIQLERYFALFSESYLRESKPVRLLGLGVHFEEGAKDGEPVQLSLFS